MSRGGSFPGTAAGDNRLSDGGSAQIEPASSSLSGRRNSEGLSLASTAASDRLSDGGSAQIEQASSRLSGRRNSEGLSFASTAAGDNRLSYGGSARIEPASSRLSGRRNIEGLSLASTAASDRLSDGGSAQIEPASNSLSRRENNCVSVANSRATSSQSDTGNNQRSGFAANNTTNNGVFHSRSNKAPRLASTTINDSVCDRGNNHSGSSNSASGDGLSGGGSIHSGPSPVVYKSYLVLLQSRSKVINQQSNRLTEEMPASDAGKHTMSSVTQDDMSVATSIPSTEIRSIDDNGLIESYSISEATAVQNPQLEVHSNITVSSVSQTVSDGIQPSSQQRHLSDTVTTQPLLTNSTPVVTVQTSENQDNVPGVLRQENGMSSTIHIMQNTLNSRGCELLDTHHVTHIAAESEPPDKSLPVYESTCDTVRTGHHDAVTLKTYRKKTSDAKSRNQSKRVEVFGHTNEVQVGAEVSGVQDAYIVENVVGRQDKCGVESGIPQKCSSPSYLTDPGTGVGSDVAGEDGNSSSAEVMSGLLEEREVTILADFERVYVMEEATGTEDNRECEPEIEVVSCMLV
jgi:hypothetical protein